MARSRLAGEELWRETTLADAGSDVIARVGAARVTGSANSSPLLALRCLTASLRTRQAEGDDAIVIGALVAGAAPMASRDLDAIGAALVVLRDASVSEEAATALNALRPLAEVASVSWPASGAECEKTSANH